MQPAPKHLNPPPMTTRQEQIIDLLKQGYTQKEVAYLLNISHRTVKLELENLRISNAVRTTGALLFLIAQKGKDSSAA